jgi:hypothetical protein
MRWGQYDARGYYQLCLRATFPGMGLHSHAHRHLRGGTSGKRFSMRGRVQKSFHEKRYQLLYRKFGRRRLHGHTDMFATDRSMGCNGDLVLGPGFV